MTGVNRDMTKQDAGSWLKALKQEYARGADRIRRSHFDGEPGMNVVREITALMDSTLQQVFAEAARRAGVPAGGDGCALVAVGGYGRGELNPHSDVDIMFLYSDPASQSVHKGDFPMGVLHHLWDLGLDLGHSVRCIDDCKSLVKDDFTIMTSLMEARFICGDMGVFDSLASAMDEMKRPKAVESYIREKLNERVKRHKRHGDSVFFREPNIKEGAGGLRDIHTALWITGVKFGVGTLEGLAEKEIIAQKDYRRLKGCRDYLLRLRNEMHYLSGHRQDVLTFDLQELAAADFGYVPRSGRMAVENFMRAYYLRARGVSETTQAIIENSVEKTRRRKWFVFPPARKRLDGDFYAMGRTVCMQAESQGDIPERPELILRAFSHSQAQGFPISESLKAAVSENIRAVDGRARANADAGAAFLDMLGRPERLYETLNLMHRMKVLGRFMPEFGAVSALVQHDLYHKYTVDEHTLIAVKNLQGLLGAAGMEYPELRDVFRGVRDRQVLFLAILLHDSGKAAGSDHSRRGAALAYKAAVRLGMGEGRARDVEFLVGHHLMLAHVCQRRELSDPKVIEKFCKTVDRPDLLDMLYLLTFADVAAVGPELFSDWRRMLMKELYERARAFMKGKDSLQALEKERIGQLGALAAGEAVKRGLGTRDRMMQYLANLPPRYLLSVPTDTVLRHFELASRLGAGDVVIDYSHDDRGFTNLNIILHDITGLFYMSAGALAAKNMNILNGKIFTGRDGIVIDTLQVTDYNKKPAHDDELWETVKAGLVDVLTGRKSVESIMPSKPAYPRRTALKESPAKVVVDNEASDEYTVIEVYARDRVGLLYDITRVLYRSGCYIYSAMVDTSVDQVVDVFYVSDIFKQKILAEERIRDIKAALVSAVSGGDK